MNLKVVQLIKQILAVIAEKTQQSHFALALNHSLGSEMATSC